jgi:chaperonin GroES
MKLRPLQDRVVVKRKDEETTSAGGIVLPGSATEKPQQGEVVAVGPGKKTNDGNIVPVDLKVGDHVVFGQYGGNTVKIDGDEFLILNENEIFGVVE